MFEEGSLRQRLGECVSNLIRSVNGQDSDVLADVGTEEMETLVDVLGARSVLGIVGNFNGTTVVLEHSAMDLSLGGVNNVALLLHFLQQPNDGQGVLQCAKIGA